MRAEKKSAQTVGTVKGAQTNNANIINLYDNTAGTVMQALNRTEATKLFAAESILIGENDVIPKDRLIELFGEKAANFAARVGKFGESFSFYGIGDYDFEFFTFKGFEQAVTFSNINKTRRIRKKA